MARADYPLPPIRPGSMPATPLVPAPPAAPPAVVPAETASVEVAPDAAAGGACIRALADLGIEAVRPGKPPQTETCAVEDAVVLVSVANRDAPGRRIAFPGRPVIACAMAKAVGRFGSDIAAPLAAGMFGKALAAIETGPGFQCRPRNRQAGAKPSAHGRGEAVDVAAVLLEGGRRVAVAERRDGAATRYFTALRQAGCGAFATVLGPGSDGFHEDHLHFDIERRGRDGRTKYCR